MSISPVAQLLEVLKEREAVEFRLSALTRDVMSENTRLEKELAKRVHEVGALEQRINSLTEDVLAQDRQRKSMAWALERIVHVAKTCESAHDGVIEMLDVATKALP